MRRYSHRVSPARATAQNEFVAAAYGENKAVRLDANHNELVAYAEQLGGWFVRVGPLEGWVWVNRLLAWRPVEIKTPSREGLAREYTPQQKRFIRWCHEHNAVWWTWRTKADVEQCLGARRSA